MKVSVMKMEEAVKKHCPHCGRTLIWNFQGGAKAYCCASVFSIRPKVVVMIEEKDWCKANSPTRVYSSNQAWQLNM